MEKSFLRFKQRAGVEVARVMVWLVHRMDHLVAIILAGVIPEGWNSYFL